MVARLEEGNQRLGDAKQTGGTLCLSDLRDYQPEWVTPIAKRYRGYEVHEIPPNGQGIAALH